MQKVNLKQQGSWKIKKLVMGAVFCALAFISMFVMRINVVFLTFDAKDAVVTLAGLLLGPLYALSISVIVPLIEFFMIGDTGIWGLIMDILSTASFSVVCALIYKYKKNIKGAVVGLLAAVLTMTAAMLLFNLFIVPLYQPGMTTAAVASMIPSLFLPFNLTKGVLNAALVMIFYKPVSRAMKAAKMLPRREFSHDLTPEQAREQRKKNLTFSIVVTAVGIAVALLCVAVFFLILDGDFTLVEELSGK
ncbi:MAG: ECF transporter S component [Clostridia bacterium]|nr:ECF transporter S component [Clostridia bacterium]